MSQQSWRMTQAWLLAGALVVAMVGVCWWFAEKAFAHRFAGVQTAFLGSSLMWYALPMTPGAVANPVFQIDQTLRVGVSSASENQLLSLANAAVVSGVRTLFIEVNPIVTRFASEPVGCGAVDSARSARWMVRAAVRDRVLGVPPWAGASDPAAYPVGAWQGGDLLGQRYPLRFPVPCHMAAWKSLVANSGATRITLIAMPRAAIARDAVGAADMAQFHQTAQNFARQLGLPLFVVDPQGGWSDDRFLDAAHMSQAGSSAFMQGLVIWWAAQQ